MADADGVAREGASVKPRRASVELIHGPRFSRASPGVSQGGRVVAGGLVLKGGTRSRYYWEGDSPYLDCWLPVPASGSQWRSISGTSAKVGHVPGITGRV